ncbi:MAG TPA: exodeoxyribonuclease VII small subunit [Opitutaceae bacterium]|nr:exodeoxyribonuclease VII small subunit [Opitutaceae bacterium]
MPAAKQPDQPSFEDALTRLESLVDSMEQGQVPLAELIARYEEGTKLLKVCEARLKDAELKIDQLKKTRDSVALEPFSPERAER